MKALTTSRGFGPIVQFGGRRIALNHRLVMSSNTRGTDTIAADVGDGNDDATALRGFCLCPPTSARRIDHLVIGTLQPLDPAICKEAQDIGREAMTNDFLHAHAAKIEARITYEIRSARLSIRDDGRGIDQTIVDGGRPGHWGLGGARSDLRGS